MPAMPFLHIPLPILPQAKPTNNFNQSPLPINENDLKDFFHSFKSRSESGTCSPLSSGSERTLVDEESIFSLDKENYDFESQLPPCTVLNIRDMLDAPDAYDSQFGKDSKELNPHATPFVPSGDKSSRPPLSSIIRARVLAASAAFPLPPSQPVNPTIAPWIPIFHSASLTPPIPSTPYRAILASYAQDLAHSHFWAEHSNSTSDSGSALADLASHFTWKAASPSETSESGVIRETIAPFAWEVFCALFDAFGEDTANSFMWHLREAVIRTFKGCWCTTESSKAISNCLTPPSEEYVASATWLVAFIGDLFALNLIRVQHIKMCLNILIHELNSLEHITAISVLIDHAGPNLWRYPGSVAPLVQEMTDEPSSEMIHLFLRAFLPKALGVEVGGNTDRVRSLWSQNTGTGTGTGMGENLKDHTRRDEAVQEVMEILAQWCPDLRA